MEYACIIYIYKEENTVNYLKAKLKKSTKKL